ncbi:MAG: sigma-E factor negative regulatory protein [Porticoccus sp.]|nr:sigma-E factor negative regulatory protein [Porticoccus sp.]
MSDNKTQIKESLSALMDGQADELEVRRVLKGVSEDDELRDTWRRHQMAAAAMRRELPMQVVDYSSAIRNAIEHEPKLGSETRVGRLLKPLGRFAVAASVAAIAVVGVQQYAQTVNKTAPLAAVEEVHVDLGTPQLRTAAEFGIPPVTARTVSTSSNPGQGYTAPQSVVQVSNVVPDQITREQVQAYLNELMLQHTEHAAMNTNQGMLPFARMPTDQDQ